MVAAFAAALLIVSPVTIEAHDPGLSSLEIRIDRDRSTATLSLAAADARLAMPDDAARAALVREAIEIRVDGARLPGMLERHATAADSGTIVVVRFPALAGSTLTVRSDVPERLARGHRQLLTIRGKGARILSERMLDARANQVDLDLRSIRQNTTGVAGEFLKLGVSHILSGFDHLLFLAALLIVVRRISDLVRTVTSFTIAHSLTLGAAVLGFVDVPGWIVEPLIAVSIVFVGVENLVRTHIGSRWKLTFAFGLVHGLGFAGALQDLAIGEGGAAVAAALAFFNLGVEAGQVVVALVLWPLLQRLNARESIRIRLTPACSVLVVLMGAYWFVERTLV